MPQPKKKKVKKTPASATANAFRPNQPRSQVTGKIKKLNAGTGKGPAHESAQAGFHGPKPEASCECGGACETCKSENIGLIEGTGMSGSPLSVPALPEASIPAINQGAGKVPTRKENIAYLTENSQTWKSNAKLLNNSEAFPDAILERMRAEVEESSLGGIALNCLKQTFGDELEGVTANEMPAFIKDKVAPEEEEVEEEEVPAFPPKKKDAEEIPVGNRGKKGKKQVNNQETIEQYLDRTQAPAELREFVANSRENAIKDKRAIIAKLVANHPKDKRAARAQALGKLSLNELKDRLADMPTANAKPEDVSRHFDLPTPSPRYGSENWEMTDNEDDDVTNNEHIESLDLPTMNWDAAAAK